MEEKENRQIIKINLMQVSMKLGTYLGLYIALAYAITVLTVKYPAISLIAFPVILGIPVMAYILIRRFRDSNNFPFFPFPVSWMVSILTFLFATVLSCMIAFLYLKFVDNGGFASSLMERMEFMIASSQNVTSNMTNPGQIEEYNSSLELLRQATEWFCSLSASGMTKQLIQTSLLWGNILSLIIGAITSKRIRIS